MTSDRYSYLPCNYSAMMSEKLISLNTAKKIDCPNKKNVILKCDIKMISLL